MTLTDEEIQEIIIKHYPCFDPDDDGHILDLEKAIIQAQLAKLQMDDDKLVEAMAEATYHFVHRAHSFYYTWEELPIKYGKTQYREHARRQLLPLSKANKIDEHAKGYNDALKECSLITPDDVKKAVEEAWELQNSLLGMTNLNQNDPKIILTNDECGWNITYLPDPPSNEGEVSVMAGNPLEAVRALKQALKGEENGQ